MNVFSGVHHAPHPVSIPPAPPTVPPPSTVPTHHHRPATPSPSHILTASSCLSFLNAPDVCRTHPRHRLLWVRFEVGRGSESMNLVSAIKACWQDKRVRGARGLAGGVAGWLDGGVAGWLGGWVAGWLGGWMGA